MITAWLLAPLAASAAATEAARRIVRLRVGGRQSRGERDDEARDHRTHNERGEAERKAAHKFALEDQRAQGDAVGDATNCTDEACQRVPPER